MHILLAFLNSLSPDEQVGFAQRCGTSVGYLRKAISADQNLGVQICVSVERESGGAVTRKVLRPTDWMANWPELAEVEPHAK